MGGRGEDRESLRNEAFSRMFDAHWASVRHHVEAVVADDSEVTEIVSEIFFVAFSRLDPARPMGRIWLLRAADRALRSRSARPVTRQTTIEAVHQAVSEEDAEVDLARRVEVLRALGVLTGRQRRIIMLTYWDGLAVGEIAELLRCPRSWVEKSLHRAQSRLRTELGLEGGEHG